MAINSPAIPVGLRTHGTIVTPGTLTYSPPLTKLFVGNSGTVAVILQGDTAAVAMSTIAAGTFIVDLAITNVTTATTATGLVGFR